MKHTLINCDLCGGSIHRTVTLKLGAVRLKTKQVQRVIGDDGLIWAAWNQREVYICPKCIDKLKTYCKGPLEDERIGEVEV